MLLVQHVSAQCAIPVSTFPYKEDFENSNGNWVTGGVLSDWAWGKPSKPVINNAGSGNKCWITGGLNNSGYNDGEFAWVQSPCFDFSNLTYPYISFKVFWETEGVYDGATLQYSIDGGNNWNSASYGQQDCLNSNWFNTSSIKYISNNSGWSGNIQTNTGNCVSGNGSGGWVNTQATLPALAFERQVIFRFLFGAGTQCNNYDGFAFDDITIGEAPGNNADFTFDCNADNSIDFYNQSTLCPTKFLWDFDDPSSGAANTSTLENPVHVFSGFGAYMVKLTVSSNNNAPSTVSYKVNVLALKDAGTTNPTCSNTADGSATVKAQGGYGYQYSWNTNPEQTTATATNLTTGTYTVTVNAPNACTVTKDFTLVAPPPINITFTTQNAACNNNNGQVSASATGGNAPYTYTWQTGENTSTITGLNGGTYNVTVTDMNGCSNTGSAVVLDINTLGVSLGKDTSLCPGTSFVLKPGNYVSYAWQDNSTTPTYTVTQEGTYYVTVTDAQNCTASDTIVVKNECNEIEFPTAFTPNGDGRNDLFGPLGSLPLISSYKLIVYNRWGQIAFTSADPFKKWNGLVNGKLETGTYVWFARYNYRDITGILQKGTVTVVR